MPEQTYSIGFGKNDFFYSASNTEKLNNLLKTIPFHTGNLIIWCNSKSDGTLTTSGTDTASIIFNSEISKIILDTKNRNDFINNYMPGNISINNNFNSVPLDGLKASGKFGSANSVDISGNIVITTNGLLPMMYGDISSGRLNYSTLNGEWNQDISINTIIKKNNMYQYIPPYGDSLINPDKSYQQVTVSANTRNPRCKFVNNCREKHLHSKSCRTETKTDASGKSFCECVCDANMEFNNNPHTHCVPINIENTATNGLDETWVDKYIAHTTLTSLLKDITMNLKASFLNNSVTIDKDGYLFANYTKLTDLSNTDLAIRETLYDYYAEIIKNRDLQANLMDNKTFNNTAKLISHDATQSYRKQYLELFNVTTGIFLASSYIYISMKSNS